MPALSAFGLKAALSEKGTRLKIGIMGGTFDPIHYGHLYIAEEVRQTARLDKVLFIPSAQPPHKTDFIVTPAEHRLEMVRLATAGNPFFEVSAIEIEMGGKSYSVRTVEELLKRYHGQADLYFITGIDAFAEIATWFDVERLITLCHFIVTSRPGFPFRRIETIPHIKSGTEALLEEMDNGRPSAVTTIGTRRDLILLNTLQLDISATDLRGRIRSGRSIRYLLPDAVESYIMAHSLYS